MARRLIVLLLLLSVTAQPQVCVRPLAWLSDRHFTPKYAGGWVRFGAKAALFPFYFVPKVMFFDVVYGAGKLALNGLEKLEDPRVPFVGVGPHRRQFQRDLLPAVLFAALFSANATPLQLAAGLMTTDQDDLIPKDFFTPDGEGSVVGVNANLGPDAKKERRPRFSGVGDYITGKKYADEERVFNRQAKSNDEMIAALLDVYKKSGPIKKALIHAHGAPGVMLIGKTEFNLAWLEKNKEKLAKLPADLFAKDAIILLASCNVGSTDKSVEEIRTLFTPFLKQGGTVVAATRTFLIDPTKLPIENIEKLSFTDWAVTKKMAKEVLSPIGIAATAITPGDSELRSSTIVAVKIP